MNARTPRTRFQDLSRTALVITTVVGFACFITGCASFPSQNTGLFHSSKGDFITIKSDGAFYWSPLSKTLSSLRFIGNATPEQEPAGRFRLVVPSSSPFLYSSLQFSADASHVTVDWGKHAGDAARGRATEYVRNRE